MLLILDLPSRLATRRQQYLTVLRGDPCAYCHAQPSGTVDHILARSKGGGSALTNLTGACEACNSEQKRDESLLLFLLNRRGNIRTREETT